MDRPRIKLELSKIDLIIETIGALGLILTLILIVTNYQDLPEIIPRHYDLNGKPDGFSSKSTIWFLPTVTLIMYIGLTILSRFPHIYNYPYNITVDNAERQYKNSAMMIRLLKMLLAFQFLYMTYAKIKIGLGEFDGLGILFTPVTLIVILGTIGVFSYRGFRLR
jgi:uncharacterized membrane protein